MIKKIIYASLIITLTAACSKEEALSEQSVVEKNAVKRHHTELDNWISETFVLPYGIEVEYRWDRNSVQPGTYVYPPAAENVQSVLSTIKKLWIDLYTEEEWGGHDFMSGRNPVKIYLYGGKNVDANGVELLYTPHTTAAEMHLYNINDFDAANEEKVLVLMRSVQHQFAKRLLEIQPYDRDKFLSISQRRYSNSDTGEIETLFRTMRRKEFYGISSVANQNGFLTLHSFLSAEDDFAEIISAMLTHPPKAVTQALKIAGTPKEDPYDAEMQQQYNEEARTAHRELNEKLRMVRTYFQEKLHIDLDRMQHASSKRIKKFLEK